MFRSKGITKYYYSSSRSVENLRVWACGAGLGSISVAPRAERTVRLSLPVSLSLSLPCGGCTPPHTSASRGFKLTASTQAGSSLTRFEHFEAKPVRVIRLYEPQAMKPSSWGGSHIQPQPTL